VAVIVVLIVQELQTVWSKVGPGMPSLWA
jgi:hypothetical protein